MLQHDYIKMYTRIDLDLEKELGRQFNKQIVRQPGNLNW